MNIFYYSVHQILEYDEVSMLRRLGHNVFCLGMNARCGMMQPFRQELPLNSFEEHLYNLYEEAGGRYRGTAIDEILPPHYLGHFSLSIVMHDVAFIEQMWSRMSSRPVIWRTIGQGVDAFEQRLVPLRQAGLKIVRYSPVELRLDPSLGQDAVIRFGKDPLAYEGWTGGEARILTFSNAYAERYPNEAADFQRIAEGMPFALGGAHNQDLPRAIGLVTESEQRELYRTSRAYLYAHGLSIPYTLNFIEAWMTGIPVIVYAPLERCGPWLEVDKVVRHEDNGFVCRTIEEARAVSMRLLDDYALAAKIGAAGRLAAIELFGNDQIEKQWSDLLSKLMSPR